MDQENHLSGLQITLYHHELLTILLNVAFTNKSNTSKIQAFENTEVEMLPKYFLTILVIYI